MNSRRLLAVLIVVAAVTIAPSAFGTSSSSSASPLTGTVSLIDKAWFCTGPVNLSSVTVVIKTAQIDAVHLASGCTGTIGSMTVVQYHGDGIKVGPGAHDLSIRGGSIRCYAHDPGKHQDGIQAMGGQRVTFTGLNDQCTSANNSALFVSEGANGRELPTDIVCASCYFAGGGFPVRIAVSLRSGIRSSRVCPGKFGSVRVSPGIALSPIDVGTTVLPSSCSGGSGTPPPASPPPATAPTTTTVSTTTTDAAAPGRKAEHRRHKRSKGGG
jgi:hypothetical protein